MHMCSSLLVFHSSLEFLRQTNKQTKRPVHKGQSKWVPEHEKNYAVVHWRKIPYLFFFYPCVWVWISNDFKYCFRVALLRIWLYLLMCLVPARSQLSPFQIVLFQPCIFVLLSSDLSANLLVHSLFSPLSCFHDLWSYPVEDEFEKENRGKKIACLRLAATWVRKDLEANT